MVWNASFSQDFSQGQLFSGPADNVLDINLNTRLNSSFIQVDDFVAQTKSQNFTSIKDVTTQLTQRYKDERKKVRSIYSWIALNIIYDENTILSSTKNNQSAANIWKNRVAVCEGYANLFNDMCKNAGIESRMVKGYVKNFMGDEMRFPNHAWNSVKVDGKWQLLDVTWASVNYEVSGIANESEKDNMTRHKLDYFFLMDPKRMIFTHLPEDPYWQLQDAYVSMENYLKGKEYIEAALQNPNGEERDFEILIASYEGLDSLDKSISFLERMERNEENKVKEYGLGIAYYYKAQKILKESDSTVSNEIKKAKHLARSFYKKSLDQLVLLEENDFGYEFSKDLANNVSFRMEVLQ
jgi:hypothetical protein